jgi:maltooligosyltrehalose trehalohydrolase
MRGDRLTTSISFEALKLTAGMVLFSPNIPLLFMGEEYGEEAPFQYFVSHTDPALMEAVRKGRREEFDSFQWNDKSPDPQDEATFRRSKIELGHRRRGRHKILFDLYRTLINLRKEIPSLSHLSKQGMKIEALGKEVILMGREYDEDRVISLFNLGADSVEVKIALRKGLWQKVFDSSADEWGGLGGSTPKSIRSNGSGASLILDGYSLVAYRWKGNGLKPDSAEGRLD